MAESTTTIQKRPIGAYIIIALAVISLPFTLYLAAPVKMGFRYFVGRRRVATAVLWCGQSQGSAKGFQIGNDPGQYAPQNFFCLVFACSVCSVVKDLCFLVPSLLKIRIRVFPFSSFASFSSFAVEFC